jgi:hypothetical protein
MTEGTGSQVGGGFPAAGDVWGDGLSDELLLVQARRELQAEQLRRTRAVVGGEVEPGPVLGSYQRTAPLTLVVDEMDELLAMVDEALAVYEGVTEAALPTATSAAARARGLVSELDVRRERRTTARVLRGAIGGAA